SRLCAPSSAARRAVRPPLTRSRLLVGEIIKRSLKLRRCRLRLLGSPLPRLLLVLALLALADECGPQLTLPTSLPTAWRRRSVCRSTPIRARSPSCTNG